MYINKLNIVIINEKNIFVANPLYLHVTVRVAE